MFLDSRLRDVWQELQLCARTGSLVIVRAVLISHDLIISSLASIDTGVAEEFGHIVPIHLYIG